MAPAEPVQRSLLSWIFQSVGPFYLFAILIIALLSLALTVILVIRGRGPMASASLLLVVHAPFWLGLIAALQGSISAYMVIATSPSAPKPSEIAEGISMALMCPLVALTSMIPIYAVAVIGSFLRAMATPSESSSEN